MTPDRPREGGHRLYGLLRQLFFVIPPERIHTLVFGFLRGLTSVAWTRRALHRLLAPRDPALASTVFGVRFPGPLGLAAGFDKDGLGVLTWAHWVSGMPKSEPSPPTRSPATRRPACSGCPPTGPCSTGWASTTWAPARWRGGSPASARRCRSG
ncbi:hypothetical protein MTIM_15090 [Mycobacterium timonense]|uniref:Dihydroorotate dehydrogenase (Quinone) n=1 Tax=Mycobacterium timonense TaxID=701043 RepID=A0A7I9Z3T4_9MYCO|nr:hypothetical protein MTIM_15090 [Mycobacterium timonense]